MYILPVRIVTITTIDELTELDNLRFDLSVKVIELDAVIHGPVTILINVRKTPLPIPRNWLITILNYTTISNRVDKI